MESKELEKFVGLAKIWSTDPVDPAHDVYTKRRVDDGKAPFGKIPHCLYIYRMKMDQDHLPTVEHYFYPTGDESRPLDPKAPIPYDSVPDIVGMIAKSNFANAGGYKLPKRNFVGIEYHHISYVCFIMDDPLWELAKKGLMSYAVIFQGGGQYIENHSFFDGSHFSVDTGEPKKRSAFYMINHMTKSILGDWLQDGDADEFSFNIHLTVPYGGQMGAEKMKVIFDPGGSNIGPPVPPPEA